MHSTRVLAICRADNFFSTKPTDKIVALIYVGDLSNVGEPIFRLSNSDYGAYGQRISVNWIKRLIEKKGIMKAHEQYHTDIDIHNNESPKTTTFEVFCLLKLNLLSILWLLMISLLSF